LDSEIPIPDNSGSNRTEWRGATVKNEILELVDAALEKAIQQDKECLLVAAAKKPGLLPSKTSKAREEAIKQCLDDKLGLFNVREEGKSRFVSITKRGIEALFENRPIERHKSLLDKLAAANRETAEEVCLSLWEDELGRFDTHRRQLLAREDEVSELLKRMASSRLKALEEERTLFDQRIQQATALRTELEQRRRGGGGPPTTRTKPREKTGPAAEEDLDFQRDTCEELVYSWQDATDSEVRTALERVMRNTGLEPIGNVGEQVSFDGRQHVTDDSLDAGDAAVISELGWRLTNARGSYLIARARVKKQSVSSEVVHVSND
jgi:hypothetical protein